jgi:hypothetical protein
VSSPPRPHRCATGRQTGRALWLAWRLTLRAVCCRWGVTDGALALSNEMVQRLPTIRLTWLVDAPGLAEGRVEVPIYLNSTRKQLITGAVHRSSVPPPVQPGIVQ